MLVTGSADTTVRVWDVGQHLLPHADAWACAKRRLLYTNQKNCRAHGGSDGATELCNDTSTLENVLIGRDTGGDTNDSTAAQKKADQNSVAEKTDTVVSMEGARNAVRSLRPEILRQAGARATWRTGRVTAVLEQAGRPLTNPTGGTAGVAVLAKKPGNNPLIEVQDCRFSLFIKYRSNI